MDPKMLIFGYVRHGIQNRIVLDYIPSTADSVLIVGLPRKNSICASVTTIIIITLRRYAYNTRITIIHGICYYNNTGNDDDDDESNGGGNNNIILCRTGVMQIMRSTISLLYNMHAQTLQTVIIIAT